MYSSAKAEFCLVRSCSFSSDTDLGRRSDLDGGVIVVVDDDDDEVVDAMILASDVSISIPSMENSEEDDDDGDESKLSELAKFILKVRQSPSELGSIDSSSSLSYSSEFSFGEDDDIMNNNLYDLHVADEDDDEEEEMMVEAKAFDGRNCCRNA
jgi:hypothetical protein